MVIQQEGFRIKIRWQFLREFQVCGGLAFFNQYVGAGNHLHGVFIVDADQQIGRFQGIKPHRRSLSLNDQFIQGVTGSIGIFLRLRFLFLGDLF